MISWPSFSPKLNKKTESGQYSTSGRGAYSFTLALYNSGSETWPTGPGILFKHNAIGLFTMAWNLCQILWTCELLLGSAVRTRRIYLRVVGRRVLVLHRVLEITCIGLVKSSGDNATTHRSHMCPAKCGRQVDFASLQRGPRSPSDVPNAGHPEGWPVLR